MPKTENLSNQDLDREVAPELIETPRNEDKSRKTKLVAAAALFVTGVLILLASQVDQRPAFETSSSRSTETPTATVALPKKETATVTLTATPAASATSTKTPPPPTPTKVLKEISKIPGPIPNDIADKLKKSTVEIFISPNRTCHGTLTNHDPSIPDKVTDADTAAHCGVDDKGNYFSPFRITASNGYTYTSSTFTYMTDLNFDYARIHFPGLEYRDLKPYPIAPISELKIGQTLLTVSGNGIAYRGYVYNIKQVGPAKWASILTGIDSSSDVTRTLAGESGTCWVTVTSIKESKCVAQTHAVIDPRDSIFQALSELGYRPPANYTEAMLGTTYAEELDTRPNPKTK